MNNYIFKKMKEYKGIYYGDDSEKKFFEGGAHFKYIKLYRILEQLSLEQKMQQKENQKELYVHKRNKLSNISQNNHINCPKNFSKEKKSRNIQDFFINNNITGNYTTTNKNKSFSITAFIKYNNKKRNNEFVNINNKENYNQTYIMINNKEKNNSNNKNKSSLIKNQKKIIISRNKDTSVGCKARPNTILKEGIQNLFMFRKNNLISNSMEQRKKKQNILVEGLNKRSFPNINNFIKEKQHLRIRTNDSYLEVNKIGGKTERNKIVVHNEKWNKSQNNFNQIKIKLNTTSIKKTQKKIKKKNFILNGNKKVKERTKSNLSNNICRNILEKFNRKEQENETKNELVLNKSNKKKNLNKKFILPNNTNRSVKGKININNQIKNIIHKPNNITQKLDKKLLNNLDKLSFNDKSRNKNSSDINDINNSFAITGNKNIKSRNNIVLNTSRTKNPEKFKTSFKLMIDKGKIPNIKHNNKLPQHKNNINNKLTPKATKRTNKNAPLNSNNTYDDNKDIKYDLMINNIPINKEKIIENINSNNLSGLKNKTLNINIINNTCIYIKPKQSKCGLKHKSRNEQITSDLKPINYTQRLIIRKKKPLVKITK